MSFFTRSQEPYATLLERPEWKIKRDLILQRDDFRCMKCGKTNEEVELQVHHRRYIEGRDPWEYNDDDLITLCSDCHQYVHSHESIKYYSENNGFLYEHILTPCKRCWGSGSFPEYRHICGGICFRCWGQRFEEDIIAVEEYAQVKNLQPQELFDRFSPLDNNTLSDLDPFNEEWNVVEVRVTPQTGHSPNVMIINYNGRILNAFADYSLLLSEDCLDEVIKLEPRSLRYRIGTRRDNSQYLVIKGHRLGESLKPVNTNTIPSDAQQLDPNKIQFAKIEFHPNLQERLVAHIALITGEEYYLWPSSTMHVRLGDMLDPDSLYFFTRKAYNGSVIPFLIGKTL